MDGESDTINASYIAFIHTDLEEFGVDTDDVPPRCPTRLGFRLAQVEEESSDDMEQVLEYDSEEVEARRGKDKDKACRFFIERDSLEDSAHESSSDDSLSWRGESNESDGYASSDDSDSESFSDEDLTAYRIVFPQPPATENPPAHAPEPRRPEPLKPRPQNATTPPSDRQLPPPLSPTAKQAIRLAYPNHGFSRSALMHQKWFWNSRHDDWVEWHAYNDHNLGAGNASTIYSDPPPYSPEDPHTRNPPSGLDRDMPAQPHTPQNLNAPIYPRIGDVTALKDVYCANIDRCFCQFALWTLQKMLYLFDMHQRAAPPVNVLSPLINQDTEADTSVGLEARESPSSCSDDDSDRTLVEDESPAGSPKDSQQASKVLPPFSSSPPPCLWSGPRPWELSWYARWELLIGLVQHDQTMRQASPQAVPATTSNLLMLGRQVTQSQPGVSRPSIIYFPGEDGDEDDDDEEDYGTVVTNPLFSKPFEHEYNSAGGIISHITRNGVSMISVSNTGV